MLSRQLSPTAPAKSNLRLNIALLKVHISICCHQTSLLSYVYTRRGETSIIDATGASIIAALFTLGAISPWYNNCCWEFPGDINDPLYRIWGDVAERRDKMGAGDISGGASLWGPATSRHIAPSVNDPVDFFVTHFQRPSRRDIAPRCRSKCKRYFNQSTS